MVFRYISLLDLNLELETFRKIIGPFIVAFPSIIGPLVFLYVKSILSKINSFNRKDLIHFAPALLIILLPFFIGFFFNLKSNSSSHIHNHFKIKFLIMLGFSFLTGFFYTIYSIIKLRKHEKHVEEYFSDKEKMTVSWIKNLLSIVVFLFIIWNSVFWINLFLFEAKRPPILIPIAIRIILVFLIFLISYYALKQPEIFDETISMEKELLNENGDLVEKEDTKSKYEKHNLDEKTKIKYLENLNRYMVEEKPYFDESLTIKNLANGLNISTHHLSILINSEFNQNFYNFINSFRVDEVKNQLVSEANSNKTILEIAYSVGFNSKSTFNTFFKKFTGKTPTEYKRTLI